MTLTELNAITGVVATGLSHSPGTGYSTPAATRMPIAS